MKIWNADVTNAGVKDFLENLGVTSDPEKAREIFNSLLDEMEVGLSGHSSLPMIKTWISPDLELIPDEPVIVIDAGGTNLRTGLISFNAEGKATLSSFKKFPMPGTQEPITPDVFFEKLSEAVRPLTEKAQRIGFCFSYPMESLPDGDGVLLSATKNIQVPGLIGQKIGEGLLERLNGKGKRIFRVVNDTVAVLLASRLTWDRECSGFIGFILGTGTNASYFEGSLEPIQAINMESGEFTGFLPGPLDEKVLKTFPGSPRYMEKLTSGAYLGPLMKTYLQEAAQSGLFSRTGCEQIMALEESSMVFFDSFLHNFDQDVGLSELLQDEKDRQAANQILGSLVERSALLSSILLSAITKRMVTSDRVRGLCDNRPVCALIDGTTWYKTWSIKEKAEAFLNELAPLRNNIPIRTRFLEHAPLIGAAASVFLK